jgi:hypothetical protein
VIYIILRSVLCGCEILCVTFSDEFSLRLYRSSVRKKISGPKRKEIAENLSELRNEELVICTTH